jgi:catechol 2,3-dioxygenase-like lactoylglutathione lyase family enzyme
VLDHIGLKVKDLDVSVRFYTAALAPLGYELCSRDATSAGFGPKDAPALWLYASTKKVGTTSHVALSAPDRKSIDRFHAAGLKHGGSENGPPGLRADYSPTYYAAFLLDPDGHNLEAVITR